MDTRVLSAFVFSMFPRKAGLKEVHVLEHKFYNIVPYIGDKDLNKSVARYTFTTEPLAKSRGRQGELAVCQVTFCDE